MAPAADSNTKTLHSPAHSTATSSHLMPRDSTAAPGAGHSCQGSQATCPLCPALHLAQPCPHRPPPPKVLCQSVPHAPSILCHRVLCHLVSYAIQSPVIHSALCPQRPVPPSALCPPASCITQCPVAPRALCPQRPVPLCPVPPSVLCHSMPCSNQCPVPSSALCHPAPCATQCLVSLSVLCHPAPYAIQSPVPPSVLCPAASRPASP